MSLASDRQREQSGSETYVLTTAAHNEEAFIEGAILSVLSQTILPKRWVIVSDNSSDRTDEIVESYARQHDFIRLLRITREPGRSFGAKVIALRQANQLLEDVEYDFIGNIDADVTLDPSYFEDILSRFRQRPELGLAAGFVYEDSGGEYRALAINGVRNAAHAAQLARRECYEAIGGYAVLKYGGEDWYAQTTARMKGWQVEAFPDLKIYHRRHTGGDRPVRNAFHQGKQDYSFGSDPIFEIIKCLCRIPERPYFGIALGRLAGFVWPHIRREPRVVPDDFAAFLKKEQKARVFSFLSRGRSAGAVMTSPRFDGE
ncbi:MAG: glycosyltransferase [Terriglobales bacterium]